MEKIYLPLLCHGGLIELLYIHIFFLFLGSPAARFAITLANFIYLVCVFLISFFLFAFYDILWAGCWMLTVVGRLNAPLTLIYVKSRTFVFK